MPYACGASYMPERCCFPRTRETVVQDICDILSSPAEDAPQVCLLTGPPGSGKSSVAHTIAWFYDCQHRMGSSYFFSRLNASRNPQNFFSTIARDLSDRDGQFRAELWKSVKNNHALCTSTSPLEQLERLVLEPATPLHAIGPLIVVVDALDESGEPADRRQLLSIFFEKLTGSNLPTHLRFLITARPEKDILDSLPSGSHIVHKELTDVPEDVVDEDIETFIYRSLRHCPELDSRWPNREWCRLLAYRSQHSFQWAAIACDFIMSYYALDPCEMLDRLLQLPAEVETNPHSFLQHWD